MFIIKCFHPTLQISKSCCRAVPDGKFEVQIYPTFTDIGFSISALSRKDRTWRTGTTKFSWQSPGRRYLAMPGKLLRRTTTSINRRISSTLLATEKEKTVVAEAESKNPYLNQEHGPTFGVIGKAQILCFAWLYTGASDGPPRDQMEASFLSLTCHDTTSLSPTCHDTMRRIWILNERRRRSILRPLRVWSICMKIGH